MSDYDPVAALCALARTARVEQWPVNKVTRHPRVQRASQLQRWKLRAIGRRFDPALATMQGLHCVSDGNGGLWSLDGGNRVESCQADRHYGKATVLNFVVYGKPGQPPPDRECAALIDALNGQHKVEASTLVMFDWACMLGDPVALETRKQLARLPKTRTFAAAWSIAKRAGVGRLQEIVDFVIAVWSDRTDPTAVLLYTLEGTAIGTISQARRYRLRRREPADWVNRARSKQLMEVGKRSPLTHYVRALLFGKRTLAPRQVRRASA